MEAWRGDKTAAAAEMGGTKPARREGKLTMGWKGNFRVWEGRRMGEAEEVEGRVGEHLQLKYFRKA